MFASTLIKRKNHDTAKWSDHMEDSDEFKGTDQVIAYLFDHSCFYSAGYGFWYSGGIWDKHGEEYVVAAICDATKEDIENISNKMYYILNHPVVIFERVRQKLHLNCTLEPLEMLATYYEFADTVHNTPKECLEYYMNLIEAHEAIDKKNLHQSYVGEGVPLLYPERNCIELLHGNIVMALVYLKDQWFLRIYTDTGGSIEQERPDLAPLLGTEPTVNPERFRR